MRAPGLHSIEAIKKIKQKCLSQSHSQYTDTYTVSQPFVLITIRALSSAYFFCRYIGQWRHR